MRSRSTRRPDRPALLTGDRSFLVVRISVSKRARPSGPAFFALAFSSPARLGSPQPAGWLDEYFDKADLDLSYSRPDDRRHFYVEALQGHIRSQQLRFEEAWDHFDKATLLCAESEENIPNLVRQFLLHIWCFENALVEAPLEDDEIDMPVLWIPELPERILADYPEVKLVIDHRRYAEALLRLHLGKWSESAELYQALIQENRNAVHNDSLANY